MMNEDMIFDLVNLAGTGTDEEKPGERSLNEALRAGHKSFFCTYDPSLLKVMGNKGLDVYPLIPDAAQYVRDMNNYGLVHMGVRRLMQLGPGIASVTITGIKNILGVLGKDFRSIITILADMEMVRFREHRPKIVFMHPHMTDLFLANNNLDPVESFSKFIRIKYGTEPGLFTNNITQLLEKLDECGSDIKYVCTPVNSRGYMMKPTQKAAEESIRRTERTIIGYDPTCGGRISQEVSAAYFKELNIEKIVVEMKNLKEG